MAVVAGSPSWDEVAREARPPPFVRRQGTRTVVSLRGEQNTNTAIDLAEAVAAASTAGDGDVVVDLSKVRFMDAAIITALVRGRNILRSQSRALVLRAPSGFAGRLLYLCGLVDDPVDPPAADADRAIPRIVPRPSSALSSATAESSSVSPRRLFARRRTVVWLRGDHDVSTVAPLSETLAGAMVLDDCDLVVDLSEVQFMGAATIGVFIRARELLQSRSRSLVLRSPSRCARRILDLCGQGDLLEPVRTDAAPATGTTTALGTWVTVPTADRVDQPADASAPDPSRAPDQAPVSRIAAAAVASVDADHRADERTAEAAGREGP